MKYLDPETGEETDVYHTQELLADLNSFFASECSHPERALRRIRVSGGAIQVKDECQECGKPIGLAKAQGPETANLPFGDPEIAKAYAAKRRAIHLEILRKHRLLQQNRNSDWWKAYKVYLLSPEWAAKRRKILERAKGACEGCGNPAASMDVHHISYANRFDEFLFELVALCPRCHLRAHPKDQADSTDNELACCGCRYQSDEFDERWCAKFNIPARAALSLDGRCGPSAKALEPLR
jgi:hypothetical protein